MVYYLYQTDFINGDALFVHLVHFTVSAAHSATEFLSALLMKAQDVFQWLNFHIQGNTMYEKELVIY